MRKLVLLLAALSIAALVAVGCGNDEQAASSASELVPAGSLIYGEVTLKPRRATRRRPSTRSSPSSRAAGSAGDKLKDLLEKALRESDSADQLQGRHRALARRRGGVLRLRASRTANAEAPRLLVATDDEDKAREALEKSAEGKVTRKTYKDVEYIMDEADEPARPARCSTASSCSAPRRGVKAAIDTSKGGETLSDADGYTEAIDDVVRRPAGALLHELAGSCSGANTTRPAPVPEELQECLRAAARCATVDADKDGVVFEGSLPEATADALAVPRLRAAS